MSNEPHKPDRELERDLASVQAEWSRMEHAEPPELLDQAVKNAARRDLESGRKSRPLKWLGGFATATVVVLALTVVLDQEPRVAPPAEEQPNGVRLEKQSATAPAAVEENRLDQAPLPDARPRAMAREAKREAQSAEAFSEPAPALSASKAAPEPELVPESNELMSVLPEMADTAQLNALEEALLSPEDWIEQLLQLRADGQTEELEAGLRAFREAYPDYALPETLVSDTP